MISEETEELFSQLREAGYEPSICEDDIPTFLNPVHCGSATEIGDVILENDDWYSRDLIERHQKFKITAIGDNVLAWIDGQCTVKTLFTDEEGMRWLVPQNDSYDAILLKEEMDVRILGVVLGVEKASVRASSRKAISSILRTKKKLKTARNLSTKQVDEQLIRIGEYVQHARQWYAVMRAMADAEVQDESDFDGFCSRICLLLPQHKHLPDAKELQRMAVLSFAKQVAMWVECDAPVTGKRFRDYLAIAKCMAGFLSNEAA